MHSNVDLLSTFNDDEPFIESVKEVGKEGKVDVKLVAQRSQVKLGEVTVLPAMCQVTSSGGNRTSVDLICVIDVSGSMGGEKINLVRETMKFLVETLTPSDRLSIITFESHGERVCGLKAVTQENMVAFTNHISELSARGGTNIMSGMELAFKTIRDRKVANKATSVFLLSDGQDGGADNRVKSALDQPENKDLGVFSIQSFGFGQDHDESLMNKIACLRDGAFYFIKELGTLDEAFCNALGGIISLVASEILVSVRCIASGMVGGVRVSKVFGDKWEKVGENEYRIRLTQMMSEISKEFVFELTVPAIGGEVGDIGREHVVLEGIMQAKGVHGQQMEGACNLFLTLINPHEEIAEVNENVDVIENYLRVKAAEAIEENMKKAEANKFEEAQQGIDLMIHNIQNNKKARKEKMDVLVQDLQQIRSKCSKQDYQQEGKKWMVSAQNAHSNKMNYQYANSIQQ
jgi:uncharacterized protein YegL